MGRVYLDTDGKPIEIEQVRAPDGTVEFVSGYEGERMRWPAALQVSSCGVNAFPDRISRLYFQVAFPGNERKCVDEPPHCHVLFDNVPIQ